MREWGETILVAAGTSTTGTKEINALNKAHTVTFDLNYSGSTPFVSKISYLTNLEDLNPLRNGYVFKGWYLDQACTPVSAFGDYLFTGFVKENAPDEDEFTVYAKWEEFAQGAATVTVFDSDSLFVNSDNYGLAQINYNNESQKTAWFKIPTVPGNVYKICWVGYNTCKAYDFIYNGDLIEGEGPFAPSQIYLFNSDATKLPIRTLTNDEIANPNSGHCMFLFTAESTETVVCLEATTYRGAAAFRVTNYNPDSQETDSLNGVVQVLVDEIEVTSTRYGTRKNWSDPYTAPWYWRFNIVNRNDYDEVHLYLNGKPLETVSADTLCCDDYPAGVYTISIEAKKTENGEWYSYSAQFTINESDHSQGE